MKDPSLLLKTIKIIKLAACSGKVVCPCGIGRACCTGAHRIAAGANRPIRAVIRGAKDGAAGICICPGTASSRARPCLCFIDTGIKSTIRQVTPVIGNFGSVNKPVGKGGLRELIDGA